MILVQLSLLIVIENTSCPIFLAYSVRERCAKKNQQQQYILVCDVSQIWRWFSWSSQKKMQNKTLPYVKIWHARKFTTSCRCWSRNGDEQTWHQGWLQYCVLLQSHRCQEPLQWLQTTGRSVFTASRSISSIRHYWTWTWASLGLLSLTTSAPCRNSSAAANP
jgi:hypothetical protein